MASINVTIGSRPLDHAVPVSAGLDIITFCELTVTLFAETLGDVRPGDTFLWEQVLQYEYTTINRTNNTITATGNLTSTLYSARELIGVYVGFEVVEVLTVISAVFDGINTILTIRDPIPVSVHSYGAFVHAGLATNGTFVWNSPTNQATVVLTPTMFDNKRFRFWSNRGKRSQRFDDVNVILTPEDTHAETSAQMDNMINSSNPCRQAVAYIAPNFPIAVGQCTDGVQQISLDATWRATWDAPSCDNSELIGYIAQQSCNGGDTWTTLAVTNHIREYSVPVTCSFRVWSLFKLYNTAIDTNSSAIAGVTSLVVTQSNTVGALVGYDYADAQFYAAYDTSCAPGTTPYNFDPLTAYQVSDIVVVSYNTDLALGADIMSSMHGSTVGMDAITAYQVSSPVILTYNTDTVLGTDIFLSSAFGEVYGINTIIYFQSSGSVTIGG